jgi:hypothetical protein
VFVRYRDVKVATFECPNYDERDAALATLGVKPGDNRGKENIERGDCEYGEWTAFIKPEGFADLFHNRVTSPMGFGIVFWP